MRLNPCHGDWYYGFAAFPYLVLRRYDEAIALARRAPNITADMPAIMAAAYALNGDVEAARRYADAFRETFRRHITFGRAPEPGEPSRWILHVNPFRNAADTDHLVDGLRRAGLMTN